MPGGDRTGPRGMGAITGRGAGFCTGNGAPGYLNRGFGMGFSGRGGGGRGWRNWFHATGLTGWQRAGFQAAPVETELEQLKAHAAGLENSLGEIKKRIEQLETVANQ